MATVTHATHYGVLPVKVLLNTNRGTKPNRQFGGGKAQGATLHETSNLPPAWWRDHWRKTGLVEVTCADEPPEADAIWAEFVQHTREDEHPPLLADAAGPRLLTFARVVARKPDGGATA